MAFAYKEVIKYRNVTYDSIQNRANSKETYILATDRNDNFKERIVAEINNKTHAIKWLSDVPEKVKASIEGLLK